MKLNLANPIVFFDLETTGINIPFKAASGKIVEPIFDKSPPGYRPFDFWR